MLSKMWTDLMVHGSGDAGEAPVENTGEDIGPGKVEKPMRVEGKRNRGQHSEISRTSAYRFATKFLSPKTLLVYNLRMLSAEDFPMSHPTLGALPCATRLPANMP